MSEQDTGFTTEGFKDAPNIHVDSQRVHDIATWTDEKVEQELLRYDDLIKAKDLVPRADAQARQLLEYLMFEWQYRRGSFAFDMRLDEVCEGV